MKRQLLLIFAMFTLTAWSQESQSGGSDGAVIEQVEISGIPQQRLSQVLRDELQRLVGQPYDPQVANQFADRIQSELPEFVERILQALKHTDWNVSAAARMLNIERTNLHKRIRTLGIHRGS